MATIGLATYGLATRRGVPPACPASMSREPSPGGSRGSSPLAAQLGAPTDNPMPHQRQLYSSHVFNTGDKGRDTWKGPPLSVEQ